MSKFKVGDRVVDPDRSNLEEWNEYEDDTTRGEVTAVGEDGKISCKWDDSWHKPSTHNADDLITEAEADKILAKLEKEFEKWAAPIRKKMEQAAKLLSEAGELASAQGKDLSELHEIVGPLIGAMDDVGWRTSSLSC
jgi:hypothetical protein